MGTNDSGSATTKSFVKLDNGSSLKKTLEGTTPKIAIKLSDVRVYEGQPLKLQCKIYGEPLPEIIWYKDGEKVVPSDRLQLERDSDGNNYLIIPKCTLDDDGQFKKN